LHQYPITVNDLPTFYTTPRRATPLNLAHAEQGANELHMEGWMHILQNSNPPALNTPLSPYAFPYQLDKYGFSGDGSKLRAVTAYEFRKKRFDVATVKEVIESFRKEGTWPETPLYQG